MEIQDNVNKANEICAKHIFDSNHFDCCMEMAEWKDEWFKEILRKELNDALDWSNDQHTKEKQQWIEKACEWLNKTINSDIDGYAPNYPFDKMINDFKKSMKGE